MEIEGVQITRRRMLMAVSIGAGSLVAAIAAVPILGFFLAPVVKRFPPVWRDVGSVDAFKMGEMVNVTIATSSGTPWDGPARYVAAWVRRDTPTEFVVYDDKCTHLGCPVRWIAGAQLFMCPCHGGVYHDNGDVAAGPPPKALQKFPVRVVDGRVQVQWNPEWVDYTRNSTPCPGRSTPDQLIRAIAPARSEEG